MPGFFEKEESSVIKARIVESEMPMNAGIDPEGDAGYLLYGDALFRKLLDGTVDVGFIRGDYEGALERIRGEM